MEVTFVVDRMPECTLRVTFEESSSSYFSRYIHGNSLMVDVGDASSGHFEIAFWKMHNVPGVEARLIAILVDGVSLEPINRYISYVPDLKKHPDAPAIIEGCDHFGYEGTMVIPFKQPLDLWKLTAKLPNEKWIETDYGIYSRCLDKLTAQ